MARVSDLVGRNRNCGKDDLSRCLLTRSKAHRHEAGLRHASAVVHGQRPTGTHDRAFRCQRSRHGSQPISTASGLERGGRL